MPARLAQPARCPILTPSSGESWDLIERKQLIHRKIEGLAFPMRACIAGLECDGLMCLTQGIGGRMLLVCLSNNSSRTLGEPPPGPSLPGLPWPSKPRERRFPTAADLQVPKYCSFPWWFT